MNVGIKLVIVDDAPFIREVLRHVFATTDVTVVGEAQDGEEAIHRVKELQPDVVLMDIVMPRKSGIEACSEILKSLPDTKIIACSTLDQSNMVMRALEAGCCNYLTKPFNAKDVLEAVVNAARGNSKEVDP